MKIIKIIFFLLGLIACFNADAQTKHKLVWKVTPPTKVNATIYQAKKAQTDSSPCLTACQYNICDNPYGVRGYEVIAVSQDFIKSNKLNYHDVVQLWKDKVCILAVVVDCMNKDFKQKIDFMSYNKSLQGVYVLIPTGENLKRDKA